MANELYCDNFIMTEDGENFEMTQTTKGDPGEGVPTGGTAGQVLKKVSDDDYDTEWADNEAGDVGFDSAETYQSGTVGKTLNDLSRQLSDLEDTVSTTQIINSASGAIASFDDGADSMPIRKLVANIEPVQDLHGYDSPWPAGGGVNKLDPAYFSLRASDEYSVSGDNITVLKSDNSVWSSIPVYPLKAGTYIISRTNTSNILAIRTSDDDYFSDVRVLYNNNSSGTFTLENDGGIKIKAAYGTSVAYPLTVKLQIESGSTATAYAPYSNICPISGHTGAEVARTGKNLIEAVEHFNIGGDGTIIPLPDYDSIVAAVKKDVTYKISVNGVAAPPHTFAYFKDYPVSGSVSYDWLRHTDSISTFIATIDGYIVCRYSTGIVNPQFEIGSVVTEYEPYTGNQVSVSFGQTVYGGMDEVVGGNGTSTMGKIVFDGTQSILATNWQAKENSVAWIYTYTLTNHAFSTSLDNKPNFLADKCPVVTAREVIVGNSPQLLEVGCYNTTSIGIIFRTTDMTLTTESAINAYLAENPVTLVYELATPTTFTHEGQQIDTLYGSNNIWSDTGDTEVTYPADTKLYIDGKIADAIAALQS